MKKKYFQHSIDYAEYLQPENELERLFLEDKAFLTGLGWGKPRYGHPEGEVYKHIKEVLENVDLISSNNEYREALRIITFVHDTFKYLEDKSYPRDWSKHHSVYAKKFLEQYTSRQDLLIVTELHDEAYHCWCLKYVYNRAEQGEMRLQKLLRTLDDRLQLYYLFFKCDTATGDKNQAPLKWFEQAIPNIDIKNF